MVAVEFLVDMNGQISNLTIVRDIGYGCGEALIKAIKAGKRWNPASQSVAINQKVTVEIPFKLTE